MVFLFSTTTMPHGIWTSSQTANAQMDGGNQTAVIDQLVSNLCQAKESLGGDNYAIDSYYRRVIGYTWQADDRRKRRELG